MVDKANILVNKIDLLKEKQDVFGEWVTELDDFK